MISTLYGSTEHQFVGHIPIEISRWWPLLKRINSKSHSRNGYWKRMREIGLVFLVEYTAVTTDQILFIYCKYLRRIFVYSKINIYNK